MSSIARQRKSIFASILLLFVLESSALPAAYIERDADCDYEEEGRPYGPNGGPALVSPNAQNSLKGFKPLYISPDLEDIVDQQQYNVYHEPIHGTIIMPRIKFALNTGEGDCIKEGEDDDYDYFGHILPKVNPKFYANVGGRRPLPGQPQRAPQRYGQYRESARMDTLEQEVVRGGGGERTTVTPPPDKPGTQSPSAHAQAPPNPGPPPSPQKPNWEEGHRRQGRVNTKRRPVSIWPNPYYGPTIEEMMPFARIRKTPDTYIVMADDPVLAVDSVPKCEQDTAQGGFDQDDLGNFSPTPGAPTAAAGGSEGGDKTSPGETPAVTTEGGGGGAPSETTTGAAAETTAAAEGSTAGGE